MKMRASKKEENVFSRVREAISARFAPQRNDDARLKRGAELFAEKYSETMKMLAKESKER